MRIKRLEIYGYGKWVDTTFVLPEDMHLFYGENEAGKSTLMSFIHSILFGFPTRNSVLLRYEPRESSRYGGKIIAEDSRFGEVVIERVHGKVTGNVTVSLEDGTTGTDELLDSVLYGMDRTMFQNIFSFSLTDIENVHRLNKEELSRYLLTIGTHGTEHYLELADQFHEKANKLYRPSGRVLDLNKQLDAMQKQEAHLHELEKNNENYLQLIEQNAREMDELKTVEDKESQLKEKLTERQEFKKQLHILEEIQQLKDEIKKIKLPPLKEDGRYLLDEYKRELADLQTQLQELKQKQRNQLDTFEEGELFESYQADKESIDTLETDLPELIETLSAFENSKERINETKKQINVKQETLEIKNDSMEVKPFSNVEQQKIRALLVKNEGLVTSEEDLKRQMNALQNELNLKNQKLDQYEESMWDAGEFKEVEAELEMAEQVDTPATNRISFLISGGVAILFAIGAFLVDQPFNWLLGLAAFLAILIGFLLSRKGQAPHQKDNTYLIKEFERQKTLKDEWQDALSALDTMQEDYQALLQKQEEMRQRQKALEEQWQAQLNAHTLPKQLSFMNAEQVMAETNHLHELFLTKKKQVEKQNEFIERLEEKTASIPTIFSLPETAPYQERISKFRSYLQRLKAELSKEQEKIEELNALSHEEKQVKGRIKNTKEKLAYLLETADVKTEEAFLNLYKEKDIRDKKVSRLKFLQENAPPFDATKKLPTQESLEAEEQTLRSDLKELLTTKREALRKQTNTQLSIERLEKDGTYTEALQTFENQKATTQRLVDEWVSDKLAAGMIQKTLNRVTNDRFEEILADAQNYFHLLTDGEYEKIVFKEEELFVEQHGGQVVDVRALSRGTAEPLYVAIRLAYIKNTQDIMELPIIMDDPFVNFDSQRRQNMYRLLRQLSEELQIIYFTFDPDVRAYFTENQINDLEMRKKNG